MANEKQESIEGVDFFGAIQAHVLWRVRLESYVNGTSTEKLNPDVIGCDDRCALGQWIYGAGGQHYGNHPKFPILKQDHACFHKYAAEVVRSVDAGNQAKARELLKGEYSTCSHKVKSNLAKLGLESGK